jgi:DNA-binding transcriptional LysR family regulator
MLDVKRLRVLREVAAKGSFSAAAESLAYTQSAVSQQIATLEKETGTTLLERNAKGVRLTDAGRVLVEHAEAILCRLAAAEDELDALAGLKGGRVRLASFPSAGATIVPRAVAEFRQRHPAVEIQVDQAEPDDGLGRLRAGETDVALTIDAFAPSKTEGIDYVHLLDDPMYIALPENHPLASRRRLRFADLAGENWILGTTGACPDGRLLMAAAQAAGFEPRIAFHSDDYLAVQGFIAAGVGVALIPDLALVSVRDDIVIRSLGARPPSRKILAATLTGAYRSAATQALLDILVEVSAGFCKRGAELELVS